MGRRSTRVSIVCVTRPLTRAAGPRDMRRGGVALVLAPIALVLALCHVAAAATSDASLAGPAPASRASGTLWPTVLWAQRRHALYVRFVVPELRGDTAAVFANDTHVTFEASGRGGA